MAAKPPAPPSGGPKPQRNQFDLFSRPGPADRESGPRSPEPPPPTEPLFPRPPPLRAPPAAAPRPPEPPPPMAPLFPRAPAVRAQPPGPPPPAPSPLFPAAPAVRATPPAAPLPSGAPRVVSVTELTRELKGVVEPRFSRIAVRGELSNYKPAVSGHHYFTLKDQGATIGAVLFRNEAVRLKFKLKDGLAVVCRGRLSVYEQRGQYQILCDSVEPVGAGALALAFEQLKQKLMAEGLFDPARKRKLPVIARRIGVVTSTSGAALRDFLRVLHDRFPIPVLIAPARVQGDGAAEEVARAIARLNRTDVDVIVVTRGGGSIEDLWAFNEEVVARAIAASKVPVVSAVGHEVDHTIADFVADLRCATPTDAAKTLAPVRTDLLRQLAERRRHLRQMALRLVSHQKERLRARAGRLGDPRRHVAEERLRLDHAEERLQKGLTRAIGTRRERLDALAERLRREHPRTRLARASKTLSACGQAMAKAQRARLAAERARLTSLAKRLQAASPAPAVARSHRGLNALRERADKALARRLAGERVRLSKAAARLESLSPLQVLSRGYAVAFDEGRRVVKTATEVPLGTRVAVLLSDRSELEATVTGHRPPAVPEKRGA
ncbi:MAG: exodeoxyribonuclease VII large subunit [Myxococcales bacterium]